MREGGEGYERHKHTSAPCAVETSRISIQNIREDDAGSNSSGGGGGGGGSSLRAAANRKGKNKLVELFVACDQRVEEGRA